LLKSFGWFYGISFEYKVVLFHFQWVYAFKKAFFIEIRYGKALL